MCQAQPDKDEQEEEEMEQQQEQEEEDEERGWHGQPQPATAGMDTGHDANDILTLASDPGMDRVTLSRKFTLQG